MTEQLPPPEDDGEDALLDAHLAPNTTEGPQCPYRALWSAVIQHAFRDACNPQYTTSAAERERCRQTTRRWFLTDKRDFEQVCDMAGIDAEILRSGIKRVARSKWRQHAA